MKKHLFKRRNTPVVTSPTKRALLQLPSPFHDFDSDSEGIDLVSAHGDITLRYPHVTKPYIKHGRVNKLISRELIPTRPNDKHLENSKTKDFSLDFESYHLSDLATHTFLREEWFVEASIPLSDRFLTKNLNI